MGGVAKAAAYVVAIVTLAACGPHTADVEHGKQLYAQNCAVCHGPQGQGGEGPPLRGELARKDSARLQAWIKKPAPPMPVLYPKPLNDDDVADVAAYVETIR